MFFYKKKFNKLLVPTKQLDSKYNSLNGRLSVKILKNCFKAVLLNHENIFASMLICIFRSNEKNHFKASQSSLTKSKYKYNL